MSIDNLAPKHKSTLHDREWEWEGDLLIKSRELVSEGVVVLTLTDPAGAGLPEWSPGAHIDLLLSDGLIRQYSLCGDIHDRRSYRIGVLLDPGSRGGSQFVHDKLQAGGTVRVRGPRNHFRLIEAPEYLFIAGGIGITPMLPMIAAAQAAGANWRLFYGGRTRDSMAFRDELSVYGDRVSIFPQDEVGRIPLISVLSEARDDVLLYVCGPEPLLDAVETGAAHWPADSLHTERFAAKPVDAPADALESFEVVCQRSGISLSVGPDQSILHAVEKAGLKVLASCRAGVCGTCEVDILEGKADHRDTVLSRAERESNEFMLVCCSRSLSPKLVLDI
uniref:PDR/VanB family oxidoreductase n=1 Tax=Marinobacterium profundum TaxID=1714300 RepID=UPI00083314F3|nr:PDR/VanB family oxidoreductase [Marinobacterium profundum]